jgi:hypothetical protein
MNKNLFLISLSERDRTMFGRVEFADQPKEQQVFSAIWELESQVNNGGFMQHFTAADGHSANFAPKALRAIKANRCAEIVAGALRAVSPSDLPIQQAARREMVDGIDHRSGQPVEALAHVDRLAPDENANFSPVG